MRKILVVEDEENIRTLEKLYLQKEGYEPVLAATGREALRLFDEQKPDLVLLDLMLPELSGEEVCREIRKKSTVPIIMVTAKSDEIQKLEGLEIGADDYVTKPFSPRELMARIKAALRRYDWERLADTAPVEKLVFKDIVVYPGKHRVVKAGKDIMLTPKEFEVFTLLVKANGEPVSRSSLIKEIYGGSDDEVFDRTIDAYIKNIRKKIQDDPGNPTYIESIYGVGYRILV
jgi:DNA-binding response OmpR family regulator